MMNLLPHHRFHIPNGLAVFAALLLLVTSVAGFENGQEEGYASSQETMPTADVECADSDYADEALENRSRGINLGLLLFRR